jgi:signal transduction histidine kinase/CheY-like chemotaxis protein
MTVALLSLPLVRPEDLVPARQRIRDVAAFLGFEGQDLTRIATAVSEIARNALKYAGGGKIELLVEGETGPQVLLVRVSDRGQGVADLPAVLSGQYRSATGMGLGIVGARRLMDAFEIDTAPGRGTTVQMRRIMPRRAELVTPATVARMASALARQAPRSLLEEVQQQNRELLRALEELQRRQEELTLLNGELEDTNRGVVALYAELDEKADHLRRADELKSRFLSNMSHEFRTPLNSILALARLLLDRLDGPLTSEQARQIGFIQRAADDLFQLVNDLLDLAKVEAGKTVVRPIEFTVANLFGALRGMLRPLLLNTSVSLVFEDASELPALLTDEAKISQILRNFISNALKFTERGEIRVSAALAAGADAIAFSVTDTGIGIAPEDQELIFQEFTQIDSALQRKVKGTGLGLPLTKRLAELLGGSVSVVSSPGIGSTFTAVVPRLYSPAVIDADAARPATEWEPDPTRLPVLVVEDQPDLQLVYQKYLGDSEFQVVPATTTAEARQVMRRITPAAIVLDILLRAEDAWSLLAELKRDGATRGVPVLVVTDVSDHQKAVALGADAFANKPIDRDWLVDNLRNLVPGPAGRRILIIDDDQVSRYLLRGLLRRTGHIVTEAGSGAEGLEKAREQRPDVIFCDLLMPGMPGLEVLERLATDPVTRGIPVIVNTAGVLPPEERALLEQRTSGILSKDLFGRNEGPAEVRRLLAQAGIES